MNGTGQPERIPIIRRDEDGTIIDGTAAMSVVTEGQFCVADFRDLDGNELILPPQSTFEFVTELPFQSSLPPKVELEVEPYFTGEIQVKAAHYKVRHKRPSRWARFRQWLGG